MCTCTCIYMHKCCPCVYVCIQWIHYHVHSSAAFTCIYLDLFTYACASTSVCTHYTQFGWTINGDPRFTLIQSTYLSACECINACMHTHAYNKCIHKRTVWPHQECKRCKSISTYAWNSHSYVRLHSLAESLEPKHCMYLHHTCLHTYTRMHTPTHSLTASSMRVLQS